MDLAQFEANQQAKADETFLNYLEKSPLKVESACLRLRYKLKDLMPIDKSLENSLGVPSNFSKKHYIDEEFSRYRKVLRVLSYLSSQSDKPFNHPAENPRVRPLSSFAISRDRINARTRENIQKLKEQHEVWTEDKNREYVKKVKIAKKLKKNDIQVKEKRAKNKYEEIVLENKKKNEDRIDQLCQKIDERQRLKFERSEEIRRKHEKNRPKTQEKTLVAEEHNNSDDFDVIARRLHYRNLVHEQTLMKIVDRVKQHTEYVDKIKQENIKKTYFEEEEALRKNIEKAKLAKKIKKKQAKMRKSFSHGMKIKFDRKNESHNKLVLEKERAEIERLEAIQERLKGKDALVQEHMEKYSKRLDILKHRNFIKRVNHSRNYSLELKKQMNYKMKIIEKHKKLYDPQEMLKTQPIPVTQFNQDIKCLMVN